MVGRLIVGKPAGPGALPFDYFIADPQQRGWRLCAQAGAGCFSEDRRDLGCRSRTSALSTGCRNSGIKLA